MFLETQDQRADDESVYSWASGAKSITVYLVIRSYRVVKSCKINTRGYMVIKQWIVRRGPANFGLGVKSF